MVILRIMPSHQHFISHSNWASIGVPQQTRSFLNDTNSGITYTSNYKVQHILDGSPIVTEI